MATTIPAILAQLPSATNSAGNNINFAGRTGFAAWDAFPPVPTTAAQRTAVITALLAGTIGTPHGCSRSHRNRSDRWRDPEAGYDTMTANPATIG